MTKLYTWQPMYFLSILLPSISPSRNCENNSAIDLSDLAGLAYRCFITLALSTTRVTNNQGDILKLKITFNNSLIID